MIVDRWDFPLILRIFMLLVLCSCKSQSDSELRNDETKILASITTPAMKQSLMVETIAALESTNTSGVYTTENPAIKRLAEVVNNPVYASNRWQAVAIYSRLYIQHRFMDGLDVLKELFITAFKKDQKLDENGEPKYCVNYFQCQLFLDSLATLSDVVPELVAKLLEDFLQDIKTDYLGKSMVRKRMLHFQTKGLHHATTIKSKTNWSKIHTGSYEDWNSFESEGGAIDETRRHILELNDDFNLFVKRIYRSNEISKNTPPEISRWIEDAPGPVERLMRYELYFEDAQSAGLTRPKIDEEKIKVWSVLVTWLYQQNQVRLLNLLAFEAYTHRIDQKFTAWMLKLRALIKSSKEQQRSLFFENEYIYRASIEVFSYLELRKSTAPLFVIEANNILKNLPPLENSKKYMESLNKKNEDRLVSLNNMAKEIGIAKIDSFVEAKISLLQSKFFAENNRQWYFGREYRGYEAHMTELMARILALVGDHANKQNPSSQFQRDITNIVEELVWLSCLGFDSKVNKPTSLDELLGVQVSSVVASSEGFGLPSSLKLSEICYYDRNPSVRLQKRQEKSVQNLFQNIRSFFEDNKIFQSLRQSYSQVAASSVLTVLSFTALIDAASLVNKPMNYFRTKMSQAFFSKASTKEAIELASQSIKDAPSAASARDYLKWLMRIGRSSSGKSFEYIVTNLPGSFVGSYAFSQYLQFYFSTMQFVSGWNVKFEELWVNPLSVDVLMGTSFFMLLPLSNALFVEKLASQSMLPYAKTQLGLPASWSPGLLRATEIVHDTSFFTASGLLHILMKEQDTGKNSSKDIDPVDLEYYRSGLQNLAEPIAHSFAAAVLFRSHAFYHDYLGQMNLRSRSEN